MGMSTKRKEPDMAHMESGFLTSRSGPRLKAQVTALLEAAETAADEVLGISQAEAEEHLTDARAEAARVRAEAEGLRTQAETALTDARANADRIHSESRAEAEALLKTAVQDADRERRAAAAQAAETRREGQRLATVKHEQVSGLSAELSSQAQAVEAELERLRAMLAAAAATLSDAVARGWAPPGGDQGGEAADGPTADVHRRNGESTRKSLFAGLRPSRREDLETPSAYS